MVLAHIEAFKRSEASMQMGWICCFQHTWRWSLHAWVTDGFRKVQIDNVGDGCVSISMSVERARSSNGGWYEVDDHVARRVVGVHGLGQ